MKYLDYPLLTQLSDSLSSDTSSDLRVHARFEAYSVKPVGKEKRAFKEREEAYMSEQEGMDEMSFSPEMREAGLASCFGRLDEKESRKVHFLLVSTLNSAFPDHDFSSLRPDHFTREHSASQVLAYLSGSLLGPAGTGSAPIFLAPMSLHSRSPQSSPSLLPHSFSHSPTLYNTSSSDLSSGSLPSLSNLDDINLYRALNQVISMDDSDVYSWFPEPEYDPHMDSIEDGEGREDYIEEEEEGMDVEDENSGDRSDTWGTGMDLDMEMEIEGEDRRNSGRQPVSDVWEAPERRVGGLLWSVNYFFYNKRQKRILFLTCWCRHVPPSPSRPLINDLVDGQTPALPLPITASFSPSSLEQSIPHPPSVSGRRHSGRKARHPPPLRHKPTLVSNIPNTSTRGDDTSSTIPIRGLSRPTPNPNTQPSAHAHSPATPRSDKLAASAPGTSGFGFTALGGAGQGQQSPMARMRIGGFKPRQTPARMVINARAAEATSQPSSRLQEARGKNHEGEGEKRGRSESTTPGPSSVGGSGGGGGGGGGGASALTAGMRAAGNAAGSTGSETGEKKRVKV
ncbi:hypothetical protein AYX14_02602 [Cryptococcus neoformans]|nr:hypothetical protein AYX14_02602 [Cryptococcus neoformans var. grubii]